MTFSCSQYDFHPYECGGIAEGCPHCKEERDERKAAPCEDTPVEEAGCSTLARQDALRFVENYLLSDDETEVSILATHKTTARDADVMAGSMRRERERDD